MIGEATDQHLAVRVPAVPSRRGRAELEHMVEETICAAGAPIGAYQIAKHLTASGREIVPNQVYRVLRRLVEAGKIRKVHSLAAFMPATSKADGLVCICINCHAAELIPIDGILGQLRDLSLGHKMKSPSYIVEVTGQCADCATRESAKWRSKGT